MNVVRMPLGIRPPEAGPTFDVTITPRLGPVIRYQRHGGCSMDHTFEAIEAAGIGGRVEVITLLPAAYGTAA